ncbi:hypothetical protein EDEG_03285 [Edhazardia aedis USNM 41457]|uniref:Uncharacterized protein n=1 Tax=Edhazardia aedis (strain USNM 41457) TaxID=1003232 RepID=J9D408_EDHAE|nr:hypothetical protein EDEG_03285 [Edhazardia aedis USNM 41457]|eukprot:EJW02279.1 hypothetical protein EDEG_03285 [Edhazardia aedis USNM 41457]
MFFETIKKNCRAKIGSLIEIQQKFVDKVIKEVEYFFHFFSLFLMIDYNEFFAQKINGMALLQNYYIDTVLFTVQIYTNLYYNVSSTSFESIKNDLYNFLKQHQYKICNFDKTVDVNWTQIKVKLKIIFEKFKAIENILESKALKFSHIDELLTFNHLYNALSKLSECLNKTFLHPFSNTKNIFHEYQKHYNQIISMIPVIIYYDQTEFLSDLHILISKNIENFSKCQLLENVSNHCNTKQQTYI